MSGPLFQKRAIEESTKSLLLFPALMVLALTLSATAKMQTPSMPTLKVGVVIPTQTGRVPVMASLYDIAGEAARMGTLIAADEAALADGDSGVAIQLLFASSPSTEAAVRAARRLITVEGVQALVGGIGRGQAEALSALAEASGIPFFNIGSTSPLLRDKCLAYSFHIEASADMYLDVMVEWYSDLGHDAWFVLFEDSDEGRRLREAAVSAIGRRGAVVAEAAAVPGQPHYLDELEAIRRSGAQVVLLLLGVEDKIPFLAQHSSVGPPIEVALFPHPVTQTRDYLAALLYETSNTWLDSAFLLWEATADTAGAGELNERFASRWGQPMDPSGWAAYASIFALNEAAKAVGPAPDAIVAYLESTEGGFSAHKGAPLSFSAEEHQLLQPLFVVQLNAEAEWSRSVSKRLAVATLRSIVLPPHGLETVNGGTPSDDDAPPSDCPR